VNPAVPPSPRRIWVWANYPNFPHLFDWWPVLLVDAQMPFGITAGVMAGMVGSIALLLGIAVCCLRAARRPCLDRTLRMNESVAQQA
ncbi:MAG: hypothetical protein LC748_06925, partial [Thermomicrobia bacterium]|nr:hypothetical protein [Thermomicrobia bacterium]